MKKHYIMNVKKHEMTYRISVVRQPALDVLRYRAFHKLVEPVIYPIARWLDRVSPPKTVTYTNDVGEPTLDWRVPRDVWIDLKCFDFGVHREVKVSEIEVNKTTFDAVKSTFD